MRPAPGLRELFLTSCRLFRTFPEAPWACEVSSFSACKPEAHDKLRPLDSDFCMLRDACVMSSSSHSTCMAALEIHHGMPPRPVWLQKMEEWAVAHEGEEHHDLDNSAIRRASLVIDPSTPYKPCFLCPYRALKLEQNFRSSPRTAALQPPKPVIANRNLRLESLKRCARIHASKTSAPGSGAPFKRRSTVETLKPKAETLEVAGTG